MSWLIAFRQRPSVPTVSQRFGSCSLRPASHVTSHVRNAVFRPSSLRHQSSVATRTKSKDGRLYPESINVYRAGTGPTVGIGLIRITTVVVFAVGVTIYIPAIAFSPDISSFWIPVAFVGSSIPMLFMTFASSPMVHGISVVLPQYACRSKDNLKRFAANTPPETKLILSYMKLAPWPTKRHMRFGEVRRLRTSWKTGIANMEYVPPATEPHLGTIWHWLTQRYFGTYYVNRSQRNDRSAVPGVWDLMWEQIPREGSAEDPVERLKRNDVRRVSERHSAMAGRPGRENEKLASLPPKR